LGGEDSVRAGGERYLPRLEMQSDQEYVTYRKRASFFNATARTGDNYVGLIFRRPPFVKIPENSGGTTDALQQFLNDADMLGSTFDSYARAILWEVIGVGRCGSLVDYESDVEDRAYVSLYSTEQMLNWRVERVNGRNIPTLVVLQEKILDFTEDLFAPKPVEQIRVLRLVPADSQPVDGSRAYQCQVDIYQPRKTEGELSKIEWELVSTSIPLRLGKPLPLIPFVFHGPRHSRPDVVRPPLNDIITVNLDHYRLDADFKHGLHYTALPTAWVSGFDKEASLRIGASTAWVAEAAGATAGFLEFKGQGLMTFERAMDRDERLMSVLGTRLLEERKRVSETAQALELRQSGENSVLSGIVTSVSESLTQILRWIYWWNSTEVHPDHITADEVLIQLNSDFNTKGLSSQELQALVAAWQAGAISRDTMFVVFRKGEILPDGRSNEDEAALLAANPIKQQQPQQQPSTAQD
jgi:hypothetical protein